MFRGPTWIQVGFGERSPKLGNRRAVSLRVHSRVSRAQSDFKFVSATRNQHASGVRSPEIAADTAAATTRRLDRARRLQLRLCVNLCALLQGILSSLPAFLMRLLASCLSAPLRLSAGYDSCQQTADRLSKDCECGCRVGKTDWPLSSDDGRATIGNRSGIARPLLRRRTRRNSPGKSRSRYGGGGAIAASPPRVGSRSMNERELLVDCLRRLNRSGITYYLTGSMASNYWGIPRTTHDLDL